MNARHLGIALTFGHIAADVAMGGGHLVVDAALWLALALGFGKVVSTWWARRHTAGACCVHGQH